MIFSQIMLTSAVIYKQRFLHEDEIVHCKSYGIDQSRFRKPLQSSAKNVENNYYIRLNV